MNSPAQEEFLKEAEWQTAAATTFLELLTLAFAGRLCVATCKFVLAKSPNPFLHKQYFLGHSCRSTLVFRAGRPFVAADEGGRLEHRHHVIFEAFPVMASMGCASQGSSKGKGKGKKGKFDKGKDSSTMWIIMAERYGLY